MGRLEVSSVFSAPRSYVQTGNLSAVRSGVSGVTVSTYRAWWERRPAAVTRREERMSSDRKSDEREEERDEGNRKTTRCAKNSAMRGGSRAAETARRRRQPDARGNVQAGEKGEKRKSRKRVGCDGKSKVGQNAPTRRSTGMRSAPGGFSRVVPSAPRSGWRTFCAVSGCALLAGMTSWAGRMQQCSARPP